MVCDTPLRGCVCWGVGVWVAWCGVVVYCFYSLPDAADSLWFGVLVGLCCGGLRTQERVLYYFLCFDNASDS